MSSLSIEYPQSKRNHSIRNQICLIVAGYIFFLLSPVLFTNFNEFLFTPIGQVQEIAPKRFVTINSWVYASKQGIMEIELGLDNQNYDGLNEYKFSAMYRNMLKTDELTTAVVLADMDIIVVQIKDVPEDYNEVSLKLEIVGDEYKDLKFSMYSNKVQIEKTKEITEKTEAEYRIISLERKIGNHEDEIKRLEKEIADSKTRVDNIQLEILDIEKQKQYMTAEEITSANLAITNKQTMITQEKSAEGKAQEEITEYKAKIENAQRQIADTRKGG